MAVRGIVSLVAGALLAVGLGAPAQADTPAGIRVVQSSLSLVVSWNGGDTDATVSISSDASFPDDIAKTCSTFAWSSPATLDSCDLVTFSGTVYVQVGDTTVAVPNTFDFAPSTTQPAPEAWRNRQTVRCAAQKSQWSNIDADTHFHAAITVAGRTKASGDINNPLTGADPNGYLDSPVSYALTGADVGKSAMCQVTARNGVHQTTRTRSVAAVAHATATEMNPRFMLGEAALPKGYVVYDPPAWTGLSAAERKAGALRKAGVEADYGVSGAITLWATTYRTAAWADAAVSKGFCAALVKATRKASTRSEPQQVLQCSAGSVAHARRAYVALRAASGIDDAGNPVTTIQAIMVASAGNSAVTLSATWGGSSKAWRSSAKRAETASQVSGPSLVLAAWEE